MRTGSRSAKSSGPVGSNARKPSSNRRALPAVEPLHRATELPMAHLELGPVNDPFELEADRAADRFSASEPALGDGSESALAGRVQRAAMDEDEERPASQLAEEEEEEVQAKALPGQTARMSATAEASLRSLRGRGRPLGADVRGQMEDGLGRDFSRVRVHTDARAIEVARSARARALTRGHDVVFGAGHYRPESAKGKHLLAHELTHVAQQGAAPRAKGGGSESA